MAGINYHRSDILQDQMLQLNVTTHTGLHLTEVSISPLIARQNIKVILNILMDT